MVGEVGGADDTADDPENETGDEHRAENRDAGKRIRAAVEALSHDRRLPSQGLAICGLLLKAAATSPQSTAERIIYTLIRRATAGIQREGARPQPHVSPHSWRRQ